VLCPVPPSHRLSAAHAASLADAKNAAPPLTQVIAAEWYVPPNSSTLTSGGAYPHAIDGFLQTFTVPDAATGKRRTPRAGEIFVNKVPGSARTSPSLVPLRALPCAHRPYLSSVCSPSLVRDWCREGARGDAAQGRGRWRQRVLQRQHCARVRRVSQRARAPPGSTAPHAHHDTHTSPFRMEGRVATLAIAEWRNSLSAHALPLRR
jgi:hypothetical protein